MLCIFGVPLTDRCSGSAYRGFQVFQVHCSQKADGYGSSAQRSRLRLSVSRSSLIAATKQAAAVLHNAIEDCDVPDDFLEQRFPAEVCDMSDALTHQEGETIGPSSDSTTSHSDPD